jgi:O-antigen/teichoic acid export membrane protein
LATKGSINRGASFKGFLASTVQTVLLMAVNFVSIPILIKALGVDSYGVYSGVLQLAMYVALLDFGMQVSIPLRYTKFTDQADVKSLISSAVKLSLLVSLFTGVILILFCRDIQAWLIPDSEQNLSVLLLSVGFGAIFQIISRPFLTFYFVKSSKKEYNILVFSRSLLVALLTLFIALVHPTINSLAIVYSLSNLVISGVIVFYYFWQGNWTVVNNATYFPYLIRKGAILFINSMAVMIILRSDSIILLKYVSPSAVTIFATLFFIPNRLNLILGKLSDFMFPRLSEIYEISRIEFLKFFEGMFIFLVGFSVASVIFLHFFLAPFIAFWSGVIVNQTLVDLILITFLLGTIIKPLTVVMNIIGRIKFYTVASVLESVSNILLSIFLSSEYGISGVLLGTIISSFIFSLLPNIYWTLISLKLYSPILKIVIALCIPILLDGFTSMSLALGGLLIYLIWRKRNLAINSFSL